MIIKNISLVYFSPTGTTRKTAEAIAGGTGFPKAAVYDFTYVDHPPRTPVFVQDELVILGAPVYVGRIPQAALPFLESLRGNSTPCILLGVYGNRHYDDFLAELEDLARLRGFLPVAAAAFIGEHSFSGDLAGGRPNADDLALAAKFGADIAAKLEKAADTPVLAEGAVPGKRPYREGFKRGTAPAVPQVNDDCTRCGACAAACPPGAISPQESRNIDPEKCIKCRACARVCPVKAIDFQDQWFTEHRDLLVRNFGAKYDLPTLVS
jgi:ferredoxin